jgi:membrane protein
MAWRPSAWRWPGALLTAAVWMGATTLLPGIIARVANYHLTYGSLAGVMITLLFFYIVGLGLVMGANLNAELAGAHAPVKHGSIERA